jgi:hypothetical protein
MNCTPGTRWRDRERAHQIKQKARYLARATDSANYHSLFMTRNVGVAFATKAGEKRVSQIVSWIAEELATSQRNEDTSLFLCTFHHLLASFLLLFYVTHAIFDIHQEHPFIFLSTVLYQMGGATSWIG